MLKNTRLIILMCVCAMIYIACKSTPRTPPPQFVQRNFTIAVHFNPDRPEDRQQLDMSMSLLQMMHPAANAAFFNDALYSGLDPDRYKDQVVREQREAFFSRQSSLVVMDRGRRQSANWYYRENVTAGNTEYPGIVVEREVETFTGGAHGLRTKQYYVIDVDSPRLIHIEDLFQDYLGDRTRALVYEALRKHSFLGEDQPLSEGMFFSDEPELSTNFYVSEEGVVLRWDPYEIAPFSEGEIEILLPWRTIRPMMKHSGMEMMTKFNIYLFVQ
jgi:hypothetical protein